VAPGKLDHLVAGGQPYGLGLMENVVKEAGEEAGVPPDLAATARPVGAIRYICERPEGLRNDVAFCFDLELPADFQPEPDGVEVESFNLWPVEEVLQRIRTTDDFKFNVALVNLHFALRHGLLTPDAEPEYQAIVEGFSLSPS
jgi:8-oxo-dGTP pyrophosphatase MutT (NUDIX family)